MAVAEQIPYVGYIGNGTTTIFPITFHLSDPEYLVVTVNKEIPQTGNYTVDATNGNVIFGVAPASGAQVELYRETQLNRDTEYKSYNNSFRPEIVNYDFDKVWQVLQEQHMIDAEVLARIKAEIEWRRTHDANFDELSKMRDSQIFSGLKQYLDTIVAATDPNIFGGITAGIVFALDKKSVQTHLEEIANDFESVRHQIDQIETGSNEAIEAEKERAQAAENNLDEKIETEKTRALAAESQLSASIGAVGQGYYKSYATLAAANADIANIPLNVSIKVLSAEDGGDYYKATANATSLTKSPYDPLAQAKADATAKAEAAETNAKLAAQNTDVNLLLALQQIIQTISDSRIELDQTDTALLAEDQAINTRVTRIVVSIQQMMQIINENRDEFDLLFTSQTSQTVLLNDRITRILVAIQQMTQVVSESRDELDLSTSETISINTRITRIAVALQQFVCTVSQFINDDLSEVTAYFSEIQKLNRLLLQQDYSIQMSKFENFDPNDAGSNKYVEAERIVFFPVPDNVIRIDIETVQALPTAKGTVINTVTAMNVDGQILKNFGTLEVQGSSSAMFPKKNWTLALFSDETRTTSIPIKLGHMISQEELVWKANFVDNTQSRNLACNHIWQEFVESRSGFPKNEVDAVNMLNSNLTVENYNGLNYMPSGATGHVDGFQAVIYINNIFYGIGSLNIGKKRDNYNLDKNTQKHIQLEPQGNWSDVSYTNLPAKPDDINVPYDGVTQYFEIRRPSSWKTEAQGYYTRLKNYMSLSREDMQTAGIDNYFNRKNMIDYIILLQVCDLWDHMGKNSLITTWDGNIWNFMPYDLDTVFGLWWKGTIFQEDGVTPWRPPENVLIPPSSSVGNAGFFSKCRRIYSTDIDARYAALRKARIIDVDHIVDLCEELLRKFPPALLKAENTKWNTGSNSIYTSLLQTSSIHQIQSWLSVHIPVCDTYFNYTA